MSNKPELGVVIPFPEQPKPVRHNKVLTDHLKWVLRRAQRGEIKAVAISTVTNDDTPGGAFFAEDGVELSKLLASAQLSVHRIGDRITSDFMTEPSDD